MGEALRVCEPASCSSVRTRIRTLWNTGQVKILEKVIDAMTDRHFDVGDLQAVLTRRNKIESHEPGKEGWRFNVRGKSVDGFKMRVAVEINGGLVVVTAFFLE